MSEAAKETTPEIQPETPRTKKVAVIAVPVAVFEQIMEKLATQPYNQVGQLMNVLSQYQAQNVQVVSPVS